jgi:hypothetical protein
MLCYFCWAINPKCKHVIVTDQAALQWMDNMVKHYSPSNRQLVRFSLEIHQSGPHLVEHRAGVIHGGPDVISRLVATDISIDGRRDRYQPIGAPPPNIWDDCRIISESSILRILATQIPTLLLDTAWVNLIDAPPSDVHRGYRKDVIQTEISRQNKKKKSMALGPETIAKLEAACSGPMSNLRFLEHGHEPRDVTRAEPSIRRTCLPPLASGSRS